MACASYYDLQFTEKGKHAAQQSKRRITLLKNDEKRPWWMADDPSVEAWHLWIKFLKLVPVDMWSEQVQKDFAGADTMSTEDFYKDRSMYLFVGPSKDLLVTHLLPGDTWDETKHLALLINPEKPNEKIMEEVKYYVWLSKKEHKRGRPKFEPENARYPFCAPPDVNALEITLYIYNLRQNDLRNEKTKPLWELLVETQKVFPIMSKQKLLKGDAANTQVSQKKALSVVASRYLARAERIKAGVANGIFPAP